MNSSKYKEVTQTSHILFDTKCKTFRLRSGDSLYAFCITPELNLEHLYWGPLLQDSFDLRYLSQSSRMAHFDTVEAPSLNNMINFDANSIVIDSPCTLEDIETTWKNSREKVNKINTLNLEITDEFVTNKRLENYSWRIMNSQLQHELRSTIKYNKSKHIESIPTPKTKSSPIPGEVIKFSNKEFQTPEVEFSPVFSRRRSASLSDTPFISRFRDKRTSSIDISDSISTLLIDDSAPLTSSGMNSRNFSTENKMVSKLNPSIRQTFDRKLGVIGKGTLCVEYSDYGTGDFRTPSLTIVDLFSGSSIAPLKYKRHKIFRGKIPMKNEYMPQVRSINEEDASTLVITLGDMYTGLEVDLYYVSMHKYNAFTRRAVVRNIDTRNKRDSEIIGNNKILQKACSLTIDFETPALPFYLTQLSGSWARERYIEETMLVHGMRSFGSTRGVSSHQHNPFAAITLGPASEDTGETKGFSLIYSGNFLVEAEINEMGRLRFNIGIHPQGLQWRIYPGEEFETPEALMVRSNEGLGGLSRRFHRLIIEKIISKNWSDLEPPILLNTWEAKYFNVSHSFVTDLARQAIKVGINLIVLDDGWFGQRDNDSSSLGDWYVNLEKFPFGLKGLAQDINNIGCKFGLWIEPEMMSENSNLYLSHPDWYFHIPGRPRQLGRNQMVLDLSRQDVRDYLYSSIELILNSANIEYIKWDMNRPLTEVYSLTAGLSEVSQAEISHRYVLGLYELQYKLMVNYPHILLENCASGGGRFDLGMLYFSPQIWCSDNTDALVRLKIQYGSSILYPSRVVGAHVSVIPNHLTGNSARLRTRAFAAMCGTFGYELDVLNSSPQELVIYQKHIEMYKSISKIVRYGDLYRLWSPFKLNYASWMYVTTDKSEAILFVFCINSDHWSKFVPRLHLQGLLPNAEYEVTEPAPSNITQSKGTLMLIESEVPIYQLGHNSVILSGAVLTNAGLPVKFFSSDDSAVFKLTRVS